MDKKLGPTTTTSVFWVLRSAVMSLSVPLTVWTAFPPLGCGGTALEDEEASQKVLPEPLKTYAWCGKLLLIVFKTCGFLHRPSTLCNQRYIAKAKT